MEISGNFMGHVPTKTIKNFEYVFSNCISVLNIILLQ